MARSESLPQDDLRRIVEASLAHLLRLIQPNGRFVYAHPFGAPDRPLDGYNMLRHCGTLWFMLRAINDLGLHLTEGDRQALVRAVRHAAGRFDRPSWLPGQTLALVTKGAVKTGGVGLALVMLAEARRAGLTGATPDAPDDTIAALAAYGNAQREGTDFLHKRQFEDGTVLPFRSGYYTGELLFGLFTTGTADAGAVAAAEALISRRYGVAEQSHWMAYAACEAAERGLIGEERLIGYLTDLIGAILDDVTCRKRRQSTPIACRAEALTQFVLLCDRWPGRFAPDLRQAALAAADENLALQMEWYGEGQFVKGDGDDKVQIDYIQHNATAFLNRWLCA
ncbi:hypothetical protein [Tabrizicola caldifontis]|uniref:hypothetical protein n=1 Tax=Tabrizicola caldifontis TaxID=2528036 RepID=UPI001081C442|nr:hypothetical protein [Rhodobacter sp. YIM 73028]